MADSDDQSANNDYCATCGGGGELVCCDGCPRAFHLVCCDPPYDEDHPPEAESWYCAVCTSKREAVAKPPRSIFAALVHDVKRHNATKFALPADLQTYFEGTHANEDGLYVYDEGVQAKHRTRANGPTADAEFDPHKIRDTKGNFVLCFNCGLSAAGKREIVKCDYCGLHWHLDCLDPPPANAPVKQSFDGRPRALWKCPAHAIDDKTRYGQSRSVHKIRRPRNAKVVDTMLTRGLRNNGNIEIENDPSDDEADAYNDDGTIYRVTESSIKLDFMSRLRRERDDAIAEQRRRDEAARRRHEANLQARFDFNIRSFVEQRAALSLLELNQSAQTNGNDISGSFDLPLTEERVQDLIHGLVSEAPPEVVALLADDSPRRPALNGVNAAETNGHLPQKPANRLKSENTGVERLGMHGRRALIMLHNLLGKKIAELAEAEENGPVPVDGQ